MKSRDLLFAFFMLVLMLLGMAGLVGGQHLNEYGGQALRADASGFDALAHKIFDYSAASDASGIALTVDKDGTNQ